VITWSTSGAGDDLIITGSGHDEIRGGSGSDILVAGSGNDRLDGGAGRDLLIGGSGYDRLDGRHDEDILIGGTTSYDSKDVALLAVLSEWSRTTSYTARVDNLRNGIYLPDGTRISLSKGTTVFDDAELDLLSGDSGMDWFFLAGNEERRSDIDGDEVSN